MIKNVLNDLIRSSAGSNQILSRQLTTQINQKIRQQKQEVTHRALADAKQHAELYQYAQNLCKNH